MIQGFWVNSTSLVYVVCRGTIAFVWFYHGLVPKLLYLHQDELAMNMAIGLSYAGAVQLATIGGALEIVMALAVLVFWRQRWPLLLTASAMVGLLAFVVLFQPELLGAAFNPVTTNIAVLALSIVGLHFQPLMESKLTSDRDGKQASSK